MKTKPVYRPDPPPRSVMNAGYRPGSAARKPGGGAAPVGRPPGTASRLMTGGAGHPPGTASGMSGSALMANLRVSDRPMTQQGLGGPKTAGKGPGRQVQDKSYWLGVLRHKMHEIGGEVERLQREIEDVSEQNASFLGYEKTAEGLAAEIKELQGQLADYNLLMDKVNTDADASSIRSETHELAARNRNEEKELDEFFTAKTKVEQQIAGVEREMDQERRMADTIVADMPPNTRLQHQRLKNINEQLHRSLEQQQQELDTLESRRREMEAEISSSQVKQEAVRLNEQIEALEEKRDSLLNEIKSKETPQEERERLLKQVKEDNQEIVAMEKQTKELQDKMQQLQAEVQQLDMDIDENQGERNAQYKKLKKREEEIEEFMEGFDENKANEIKKLGQLERNVASILESMSRKLGSMHSLPSQADFETLKKDLEVKEQEMQKSEYTSGALLQQHEMLAADLGKVETLEQKVKAELETLEEKIGKMEKELLVYVDVEKLTQDAEEKRTRLQWEKVALGKQVENTKKVMKELNVEHESLKKELEDNETHAQLNNLERKLQQHEMNNFVVKEFVANKRAESDYLPIKKMVNDLVTDYNGRLKEFMTKGK